MVKPPAVVAAEKARVAKEAELAAAREVVKRLEKQFGETYAAVRAAWEADASALPQCRVVRVGWRSGTERDERRAAILRKTPGGMLVTRHIDSELESKFKWSGNRYVQAERSTFYAGDHNELRDVPPEYMPKERVTEDTP